MKISRRSFLTTTAVATLGSSALTAVSVPSAAQGAFDSAELLKEGGLPEKWLGNADAKVVVIEYASMTCPHCASFHEVSFPYLKAKYIDTGKIRFALREFPLDPLATAAFMLARCAPDDKYYDMVGLFFERQTLWTRTEQPVDAMFSLSKQAGFTQESFRACLTNQSLLDGVNAVKDRGSNAFKVSATPTFFVNGAKVKDFNSPEAIDKALTPLL